ncbi:hypothetical protein [Alicyclobacillus shizuokensis]|uniref:hypothetical protein n=1 Tax=Alicyclobacillus shizuokensis TaxID=392014 RepID=UPI00082AD64D|nr:hypothetical protein [Alicyclobacillus shizuokensis]
MELISAYLENRDKARLDELTEAFNTFLDSYKKFMEDAGIIPYYGFPNDQPTWVTPIWQEPRRPDWEGAVHYAAS